MRNNPVLLVLGGGRLQKKIIRQAEENGIAVVVVDADPKAPGMQFASYQYTISTTDFEGILQLTKKLNISGVLTLGTDQPVLTATRISQKLNLPSFINPDTALLVTNKELMKATLSNKNIPTSRYIVISRSEDKERIRGKIRPLTFPLVLKPVDSQGQRGVALIHQESEIFQSMDTALHYSKTGTLIVEEFLEGNEVTANAWIYKGEIYLLALTDRVTYFNPPSIGICLAHIFPSKFAKPYLTHIKEILHETVKAFHITEGPLYVQIVLSDQGPYIIELACRIGGGHEEDLIPAVTGIDVRQCLINFALGRQYMFTKYDFNYSLVKNHFGVFFIAAKGADEILDCVPFENQISDDKLLWGEFYVRSGNRVCSLTNATNRIGAYLVQGNNRKSLWNKALQIYTHLKIRGTRHENLIENIFLLPLKGV
jgi:biotin carboxylase